MNDRQFAALLEEMHGRFDAVTELVRTVDAKVTAMDERLERVEQQTALIPPMQAAIRDQSTALDQHDTRLTTLENAA